MADNSQADAAPRSIFPEGRMMIDVLAWNWNLRVAMGPASFSPKVRFRGLDYGRDFTIHGRLRAPRELRGKTANVTLSPFQPSVRFGRRGLQQLGRLRLLPPASDFDFEATLMLPEDAIAATASSLASNWRHLDIWTFGEGLEEARISQYAFSADIHPNLRAWADGD
jgi:hypothetical protein